MTKQKADELGHNVGRRVAEIRQKNGLTQQGLATSVRATVQWISRIENGEENLTLATLVKLANALSVTVRELFEEPASNPKEVRRGRPRKG